MASAGIATLDETDNRTIRARQLDIEVRDIEEQNVKNWSRLAKLCIECEEKELWGVLGFKDFESWLMDAAPTSRSTAFAGKKVYRELSPHVSDEDLQKMPHGNAHVLRDVSDSVKRDPEIVEAAKKLPRRKLVKAIQDKYPDQHIEQDVQVRLHFTESQKTTYDRAMNVAELVDKDLAGASDESKLEFICADFMDSWNYQGKPGKPAGNEPE